MPYSATRPRRAKAVEKRALSAAKRTWQNSACTSPTPAHAPLIAPMSGLGKVRGTSTGRCGKLAPSTARSPSRAMSAPGQNVVPAPVTTTARTVGSAAASVSAA